MLAKKVRRIQSRLGIRHITPELISLYVRKTAYQQLWQKKPATQWIMPIFGCQRSGTSLLTRVFFRDLNAKVYRETSNLSSGDKESKRRKLRINSLDEIKQMIDRERAALVVLKPLVESQRAPEILDYFPNARGLWLYRHYKDVAASNLQAFGLQNGINDLRPIVAGEADNWRSEGVSPTTRTQISALFSEAMNPYDAAALFWYARNRLFFELGLERDPRIQLCQYDHLVTQPAVVVAQIYRFVGQPFPGAQLVQEVHAESVSKGQELQLSAPVVALCEEMLQALDRCYAAQLARTTREPSLSRPVAVG